MLKTSENVEKSAKARGPRGGRGGHEAMSEELRPCPFCGGKAEYRGDGTGLREVPRVRRALAGHGRALQV